MRGSKLHVPLELSRDLERYNHLFLPKQHRSMQGRRGLSPPICRRLSVGANSFPSLLRETQTCPVLTSLSPIAQGKEEAKGTPHPLEAQGPTHK